MKEAIAIANSYRAYSAAIRIVCDTPMPDLKQKSRIVNYLYELGHQDWLKLVAMDCATFGRAFDASRAKAA